MQSGQLQGTVERGFGSVLGDAFGGDYPSWTVGVQVSYPLGRTAAQAALAQGQVQKRQQELALRQRELEVVGAGARCRARQVQNSLQRVQATQAALAASHSGSSTPKSADSPSASRPRSTCRPADAARPGPRQRAERDASPTTGRSSSFERVQKTQ